MQASFLFVYSCTCIGAGILSWLRGLYEAFWYILLKKPVYLRLSINNRGARYHWLIPVIFPIVKRW
jgi:hypothetical protein